MGPARRGHLGHADAEPSRRLVDPHQRRAEVALHIHPEGLQRRDVEDRGALLRGGAGTAEDPVDGPEEGRQRFSRTGRCDHEGVLPVRDRLPRLFLHPGGGGEDFGKPSGDLRAETVQDVIGHA